MPTPENIVLQVALNGGAAESGVVDATYGDEVKLSIENPAGVQRAVFRIWEYPEDFECPAGWSEDASGRYYVITTNGASPPAFGLPASETWGNFYLELEVNNRRRNGRIAADLLDKRTVLVIEHESGLEDIGFGESNQIDTHRQWAGSYKRNLRRIASGLAVSSGSGAPIADGDVTITVAEGSTRRVLEETLTTDRTVTLDDAGAALGDVIEIFRLDETAHDLAIDNGGATPSTLYTFPPATRYAAKFRFDGINWALWEKRAL